MHICIHEIIFERLVLMLNDENIRVQQKSESNVKYKY